MKKITDIKVTRYRTVEEKDVSGKRIRRQVPYTATLQVKDVSDGTRLLHHFVDGIIISLISNGLNFLLSLVMLDSPVHFQMVMGIFVFNGLFFAIYPAYYILFEYYLQATPAKFITGSKVIGLYGKKVTFDSILIRSVVRLVPFEPFSFFGKRGWHDKWSETWVVKKEEADRIQALLEEAENTTA